MDLIPIGKTQKPSGLSGAVKIYIEAEFLSELEELDVLFIKIGSKPVPFFIEDVGLGESLSVKFEDIESREAAKKLASKVLLMRKSDLKISLEERQTVKIEESDLHFKFLEGYQLVDEKLGALGLIEEVLEFPQQEMAIINYKEKEILVPLNENFILAIAEADKLVTVALPDGLVEL